MYDIISNFEGDFCSKILKLKVVKDSRGLWLNVAIIAVLGVLQVVAGAIVLAYCPGS